MLKEAGSARAGAGGGGDDVFVLPASFAQERMWFLERMAGGSAAYNMAVALRLRGALDPRALAAALAGIVRRHEVLRTTLPTLRGELVQVVRPSGPARWPLVDLSALGGEAREREGLRLRREAARRRFDLTRGPLLRAVLVRVAGDEHVALCTMHHAVSDGWSREVLARELGAGYAAALEGR
ncbi:MAG TPA: condensation domain-containing protein, partial [Longimicrobiaceae bacterium]|nr:condensation domain-containing protein [Longimicrobiaceae bacterium]